MTKRGKGEGRKKGRDTLGKESCCWQTAAGGMINSADTSFHFTTEWQDRGRKGGIEKERKGHVVKKEKHQGNIRGQQGGIEEDGMTCGWRHCDAMDSVTQKTDCFFFLLIIQRHAN